MSKLKLLKYPKRPKKTSSLTVKERYLKRIKDIDKENSRRLQIYKKEQNLEKQIDNQIHKKAKR
jgi:hypothetical protein